MPICYVCQKKVGEGALSPSFGTVSFHSKCLEITVRDAPSRRNKGRKTVSVGFRRFGIWYSGSRDLDDSDRQGSIQGALNVACRNILPTHERTHRGGQNKGRRVAIMR